MFRDTWNVPELIELDLSHSHISELPISMDRLEALSILRLNTTMLNSLPGTLVVFACDHF